MFLVIIFRNGWTIDEFIEMVQQNRLKIEVSCYDVGVLVDLRYSQSPPVEIISPLNNALSDCPANIGRTVVIHKRKLWQ